MKNILSERKFVVIVQKQLQYKNVSQSLCTYSKSITLQQIPTVDTGTNTYSNIISWYIVVKKLSIRISDALKVGQRVQFAYIKAVILDYCFCVRLVFQGFRFKSLLSECMNKYKQCVCVHLLSELIKSIALTQQ